jgi:hypothetical protein
MGENRTAVHRNRRGLRSSFEDELDGPQQASRESFSIGLAFWHVVAYYVSLGGQGRPSGFPGIDT